MSRLGEFGDVERLAALLDRLDDVSSPYHAAHVTPGDTARTIDEWSAIPLSSKAELLADQASAPPYGTRLLVAPRDLHLVVESSGSTSGTKEVHALTAGDEQTVVEMMARAFRTIGLDETDCVAITLPISTAGGGAKIYHTVRAIGALALRVGSIPTEEKVAEIRAFRPSAIVATPSYLDRLAAVLRATGTSPDTVGVQHILIATQAVSAEWVRRAEHDWSARISEWYGNASGFFAMTGRCGVVDAYGERGTLHWDPEFQLLEIVGPDGAVVAPGESGELVGTHLANATAPLIRYRLGDEAEYVPAGACQCASKLPGVRAGSIRRADGMVKFRGVSLWPSAVDRALEQVGGIEASWVVLRHDKGATEIAELFVRAASSAFDFDRAGSVLRQLTGVRFAVVPWPHDEPPEACRVVAASGKSPRWVDLRSHGDASAGTSSSKETTL